MDEALKEVNKKNWTKTKPIMVACVLAFFADIGVMAAFFLSDSVILFVLFLIMNAFLISIAIHNAWLLEENL
jgi:hypothetical protein